MSRRSRGNGRGVEETSIPAGEPRITHVLDCDTARLTVTGELTDSARRPLVRVLTELLLQHEHALARVVLDVRDVSPLQLSGLWRRFPVLDSVDDPGVAPAPEGDAS